ncbi:Metallo-dependent phosphatase-like protein [Crassisporium funariophilum]|nr:Metallo-dependent phosphatase-like protein [Crassisporium funariophilum]
MTEQLLAKRAPDPHPGKPRITFSPEGEFKVTVFSDLHFGENPWESWGEEHDAASVNLIRNVVGSEHPNYVVFNGDLVTGENTFKDNATTLVDKIMRPVIEANTPFSSTHGNHDNQPNISHLDEIERENSLSSLSYTRQAPSGIGGAGGPGNYWVPVSKLAEPSLILWFFDSRGGFDSNNERLPDWVDSSVATWIESETQSMEAAWGPSSKRGAIAFVHIPPNVIMKAQEGLNSANNPGQNADALGAGGVQAGSTENLGKDAPFWDALNQHVKNLHAVVSGHDHGNEWCTREPSKNVVFCFDKHSGYGGYTKAGWGQGVRNFKFTSTDPTSGVQTWIRMENGEQRAGVVLDQNYKRSLDGEEVEV